MRISFCQEVRASDGSCSVAIRPRNFANVLITRIVVPTAIAAPNVQAVTAIPYQGRFQRGSKNRPIALKTAIARHQDTAVIMLWRIDEYTPACLALFRYQDPRMVTRIATAARRKPATDAAMLAAVERTSRK